MVPADLSCSGRRHRKYALIDGCIAAIVRALSLGGVATRSSCCGHENTLGMIDLEDGRAILILPKPHALRFNAVAEPEARAAILLAGLRGIPPPGWPEGLDGT